MQYHDNFVKIYNTHTAPVGYDAPCRYFASAKKTRPKNTTTSLGL